MANFWANFGLNGVGITLLLILEVKKSMERSIHNERLSMMQWETLVTEIANRINDLPIALGNIVSDFEMMDLITPNRLRLGRNNARSPCSPLVMNNNPVKLIEENKRIFEAWFENWLISHVPNLMTQPKWFKKDRDIKKGDLVLFLKHESQLSLTYQFGIIISTEVSRDGLVRKVRVKYRNHNEDVFRETYRSVRSLVLIHEVDELNLMEELYELNKKADKLRSNSIEYSRNAGECQVNDK